MKIIANNFNGVLETGENYKISIESTYISSLKQYQLCVHLHKEFEDTGIFLCDDSFIEWYGKREYLKALKTAFIRIEDKYNIRLLKADLKVA